jgi:hypothetical protein
MSHWASLAGIAAIFVLVLVLGLRFLSLYSHRAASGVVGSGLHGDEVASAVRVAEAEAESIRQRAAIDAEAVR